MSPGSPPPISIVVPTYREALNIEPLVHRTFAALGEAGLDAEMIIVDDESGDGTEEVVGRLAKNFPIRLLSRKTERGLASAVLHGFAHAKHDVFVVLDADLQHPPESIPALIAPLVADKADFVIGSRYAPGGEINTHWTRRRRLNSRIANLLARPLLSVHDPMSGFFALRRDTWRRAGDITPIGYKIALELAVRARCKRCAEIPITFDTRHAGHSKLSLRQQLHYLRQLTRLYWFRHKIPLVVALTILVPLAAVVVTGQDRQ